MKKIVKYYIRRRFIDFLPSPYLLVRVSGDCRRRLVSLQCHSCWMFWKKKSYGYGGNCLLYRYWLWIPTIWHAHPLVKPGISVSFYNLPAPHPPTLPNRDQSDFTYTNLRVTTVLWYGVCRDRTTLVEVSHDLSATAKRLVSSILDTVNRHAIIKLTFLPLCTKDIFCQVHHMRRWRWNCNTLITDNEVVYP